MLAEPGYDEPKPNLRDECQSDLRAWGRAVTISRLFNWAVVWDTRPTYYANGSYLATFNPMNFISAKRLCSWMGVSERFWDEIITPYHCLNMSCLTMDEFPAVGLDALDRTAPLRETRTAVSWSVGNSTQVFKKLTENLTVKTWTRVMKVAWEDDGTIEVHDDQGDVLGYDRVVFACPASACVSMLQDRVGWLERALLRGVRYEDDVSREFMQAVAHEDPSVLPEKERSRILRDACFVLDIKPDPETGKPMTETTHNMAPWPPVTEVIGKTEKPMIVTHCLHPGKRIDESKVRLRHDYGRSHPSFTMSNLILTRLMPLVQGQRGVYYISNWVCQGNGHDLSCLSGLAGANAIGAPYLFPEDELAKLDFQRLSATLGMDENQHTPWGRVAVALGPVMALAAGLGRCSSFVNK
jgi:predicted NAD/FAD-binding protein